MILNRLHLLFAVAIFTMAMVLVSCVEIPDKAPDPPVLNAEFRFISVMPDGTVPPTSVLIAEGPNFTSYASYAIGTNATPSAYYTFLSGSKRIVFGALDTFRLTFDTDQRATLAFAMTKAGVFQALKLPYRNTFAANGILDTTLVRFTNLVQKAQDTIDVYRSDSTLATGVVGVNNILYSATSAVFKIPSGKTYKFFFTDPSSTNRVFKDSIVISGASRKVYTVFVYDKFDSTGATSLLKTAKVKVKVLEEL
jgi:hypothetical protein